MPQAVQPGSYTSLYAQSLQKDILQMASNPAMTLSMLTPNPMMSQADAMIGNSIAGMDGMLSLVGISITPGVAASGTNPTLGGLGGLTGGLGGGLSLGGLGGGLAGGLGGGLGGLTGGLTGGGLTGGGLTSPLTNTALLGGQTGNAGLAGDISAPSGGGMMGMLEEALMMLMSLKNQMGGGTPAIGGQLDINSPASFSTSNNPFSQTNPLSTFA